MKKYLLLLLTLVCLSCDYEQEYITEVQYVPWIVTEKEHHTELNPATEFFFDIKTTHVIYTLVLEHNGKVITEEVDKNIYYKYSVGDKYNVRTNVKKKNPNYKKE